MLITGITTCAGNQVASVISSLDDVNQYMNHLLPFGVTSNSELNLIEGRLPVFQVLALVSRFIQIRLPVQQKRINQICLPAATSSRMYRLQGGL